jgi:transposase
MIPAGVKVFLASHPVDFRKGPDGLLALVREAGSDPFNGALYVFRAKRADRVKSVWWDGTGVVLYNKRLEKAQFCWPRIGQHRVQLNHAQLLGTHPATTAEFRLRRGKVAAWRSTTTRSMRPCSR